MAAGAGAYDTIVVGAGSAGCVLAARLSEDPAQRVLLIEAGGPRTREADGAIGGPSFFDALDVPGTTWPELYARRRPELAPLVYRRGAGLGGSSAVNAMVAVMGHPADYDRWEQLGARGWSWRDVAPWFDRTALVMHRAAASERGPLSTAVSGVAGSAFEFTPLTRSSGGSRVSTATAYLAPAMDRANLAVRVATPVARVVIEGRRAVGVALADGSVIAARRVVVCAGAIHSPALLLVSGLRHPGIGRNLCDHAAITFPLRYHGEGHPPDQPPVTGVARFAAGDVPEAIQWLPLDHLGRSAPGLGAVMVALMHVRSRGVVRLGPTGDAIAPEIDFNMLSDDIDVDRLATAARHAADRLTDSPEMRRLGDLMIPDLTVEGLRAGLGDYVHAAGTCRMGARDDPEAVVDSFGRVHGYEGLIVADASVMPDLPRANTHLPTVMIAERLAAAARTW